MGVPEGNWERGTEQIFEEIMLKLFWNINED